MSRFGDLVARLAAPGLGLASLASVEMMSTSSAAAAFAAFLPSGSAMSSGGVRYSHAAVHSTFLDTTWLDLPVRTFDQSKGALTGSASWSAKWSSQLQTLSSLSSGFRHPNVDDLGKVREKNGFVLVPNADLKPEYLYTAEQGLTWSLRPQSDVLVVHATPQQSFESLGLLPDQMAERIRDRFNFITNKVQTSSETGVEVPSVRS